MTALAQDFSTTITSTPFSDAIARPVRFPPLPMADLTDLIEPAWERGVEQQLRELLLLREGWDGFGAGPVRRDVILFAVSILEAIMRPNTPAPHITPMSHEGIMLEWHENSVDLEIEIERPGALWMSFDDVIEGIEEERSLSSELKALTTPIEKLTKRAVLRR
jgi:hypothetical protein